MSLHWLASHWALGVECVCVCVSSLPGLSLGRRCGVCVCVSSLAGLSLGRRCGVCVCVSSLAGF